MIHEYMTARIGPCRRAHLRSRWAMETPPAGEERPGAAVARESIESAVVTRSPTTRSMLSIWPVIEEAEPVN